MPSTLAHRCGLSARHRTSPIRAGGYGPPPDGHASHRPNRVTLRCVREDLEFGIPPVEVDLGALDTRSWRRRGAVAPAAPRGQKRILAIEHPLVYRLRHGRWRGATWLETDEGRFWVCAGGGGPAGSAEDAYEHFIALHDAGRLLPDDDDRLRDALERNARIIDADAAAIPQALGDSLTRRGRDVGLRVGDVVDARLHASAGGDDIWVAIRERAPDCGKCLPAWKAQKLRCRAAKVRTMGAANMDASSSDMRDRFSRTACGGLRCHSIVRSTEMASGLFAQAAG
jgi:hypothetical protein